MKKHLFLLASLALGMAACTNDTLSLDDTTSPETQAPGATVSTMQHAKLSANASDQSRVISSLSTRDGESTAKPGSLSLIATVKNPSAAEGGWEGFNKEENGRYMSATCVYYDTNTDTYYATYHMQGNNYSNDPQLKRDVAGFIESFKINGDQVELKTLYRSADPNNLDFDFNHLYFDDLARYGGVTQHVESNRLIAVGHLWHPGSNGGSGVTKAIIANVKLDEEEPGIDYKVVYTGDKVLDSDGKSLGDEDAQDVNAVVRNYDTYYLATRKGIALVDGIDENLFNPVLDKMGQVYFIKTPGSVKHVANDAGQHSNISFLYLTDDFPENFKYEDGIKAKLIQFNSHSTAGRNGYLCSGSTNKYLEEDVKTQGPNFLDYTLAGGWNIDFDQPVSPVDGKNVLFLLGGSQYYVAMGKGGLYYRTDSYGGTSGHLEFGNRPVNGVFADDGSGRDNGFIYVCNGSKLTIFNRYNLDIVATYNLPEDIDGSANYVTVTRTDDKNSAGCFDRIITVAFGQAGLRVFRFSPKNAY